MCHIRTRGAWWCAMPGGLLSEEEAQRSSAILVPPGATRSRSRTGLFSPPPASLAGVSDPPVNAGAPGRPVAAAAPARPGAVVSLPASPAPAASLAAASPVCSPAAGSPVPAASLAAGAADTARLAGASADAVTLPPVKVALPSFAGILVSVAGAVARPAGSGAGGGAVARTDEVCETSGFGANAFAESVRCASPGTCTVAGDTTPPSGWFRPPSSGRASPAVPCVPRHNVRTVLGQARLEREHKSFMWT